MLLNNQHIEVIIFCDSHFLFLCQLIPWVRLRTLPICGDSNIFRPLEILCLCLSRVFVSSECLCHYPSGLKCQDLPVSCALKYKVIERGAGIIENQGVNEEKEGAPSLSMAPPSGVVFLPKANSGFIAVRKVCFHHFGLQRTWLVVAQMFISWIYCCLWLFYFGDSPSFSHSLKQSWKLSCWFRILLSVLPVGPTHKEFSFSCCICGWLPTPAFHSFSFTFRLVKIYLYCICALCVLDTVVIWQFYVFAALRGMWDLSAPTRHGTVPSEVEAQSANHWAARELPLLISVTGYQEVCLIDENVGSEGSQNTLGL